MRVRYAVEQITGEDQFWGLTTIQGVTLTTISPHIHPLLGNRAPRLELYDIRETGITGHT